MWFAWLIWSAFAQEAPAQVFAPSQNLNPDLSFLADVGFAWFSSDSPDQLGEHDPQRTGFYLSQLEMSIAKPVDPYFLFDGNVVFNLEGLHLEEVYATTLGLPAGLQLRAGKFLTKFGRINAKHSHAWSFVDQALPIGYAFGGEGNNGIGLEGSIVFPLPWYVELSVSETETAPEEALGFRPQTIAALKQFFPISAPLSLQLGFSYGYLAEKAAVYGTDIYLHWRPHNRLMSSLQSEVLYDTDHHLSTYSEWLLRGKRLGVGLRDELIFPGVEGEVLRHRMAIATTFWPTEFSRLRIQGAHDQQTDWSVFCAFEFTVGAHGAHTF